GAAIATLAIFPLGFLQSMGIAGGLAGPLAGAIALTVLPALFVLLGPRVNALSPRRWRRAAERTARGEAGGWYRLAHALMRRPAPVAVAATCLLLALGVPFRSIRFTGVDASVLPASVSSHVVDVAIGREFDPGSISYVYAAVRVRPPRDLGTLWVVQVSSGAPFLALRSQRLVRELRALPGTPLVGGAAAQFV